MRFGQLDDSKRESKLSGFTLLELMISVAIVGLLASVAVPSYSRFRNRARQTEARVLLSGAFTSEKTFFGEAESYTGCLRGIGFEPDNTRQAGVFRRHPGYYNVGFDVWCLQGNFTCGPTGTGECRLRGWSPNLTCNSFPSGGYAYADSVTNPSLNPQLLNLGGGSSTGCLLSKTMFRLEAAASLNPTSNFWDTWSITDQKVLTNDLSSL